MGVEAARWHMGQLLFWGALRGSWRERAASEVAKRSTARPARSVDVSSRATTHALHKRPAWR